MKFIDFHTHIYPEKIAVKATNYLRSFYDLKADWPGISENLLIFGQAAKISKFVVLPVATRSDQVRKINQFAINENNEHDEYITFGTVHAGQEKILDELQFIIDSGLRGIKMHPDQQDFAIDDKRLFDFYDAAQQIRFPILFHCGDPRSDLSHPKRVIKILEEFPNLNIVAAHFGGWQIFDEAKEIMKDAKCHFDMSSSMYYLGPEKTADMIHTYGAEKIFFGTDFPLWDSAEEIEKFMSLPITDEEKELIAYKNAERFFNITLD